MGDSFFKHALALVETNDVGAGTRIWAWSHVMNGATIGRDCNIGEHCFIESNVVLGDRVTVKNGVAVWDGVIAEDDVFLGPNAVFTNDTRPRSKSTEFELRKTRLRRGCSIGANATILCGNTLGQYAMIGAGCVVTRDVPDFTVVIGNPGRVNGYLCICGEPLSFKIGAANCSCGRQFENSSGSIALVE